VRHVWDSEEQVEVLAALVADALGDAAADPLDHPRAAGAAPDPEALARDVEAIERRLTDPALAAVERSALRDRLSALAARCPWVQDARARATLQARVDALWPAFAG
jgi:MoxR-like ATPase